VIVNRRAHDEPDQGGLETRARCSPADTSRIRATSCATDDRTIRAGAAPSEDQGLPMLRSGALLGDETWGSSRATSVWKSTGPAMSRVEVWQAGLDVSVRRQMSGAVCRGRGSTHPSLSPSTTIGHGDLEPNLRVASRGNVRWVCR